MTTPFLYRSQPMPACKYSPLLMEKLEVPVLGSEGEIMTLGMFDVATAGDDEQRLVKQATADKLNEAVYDVRAKYGSWLFGAADLDGFSDRAKLAYVDICKTIEPHMHARKGVHRRVMKTLEREWRQRKAADSTFTPGSVAPDVGHPGPDAVSLPGPNGLEHGTVNDHSAPPAVADQTVIGREGRKLACYPGCHENEAHSSKFHKDKENKEARRLLADFEEGQDRPELHTEVTYKPHTNEKLIPKGDFKGYKDSVDQGAHEKIDHNFVSEESVREHKENGNHNFVPTVTGGRNAYPEYERIARLLVAADPVPVDPAAGMGAATAPMTPDVPATSTTSPPAGTPPPAITAGREYQIIASILREADVPGLPGAAPAPEAGGAGLGTGNTTPFTNVGPNIYTPGGGNAPGIWAPTQSVTSPMDKAGNHKGHRWASRAIVQGGTGQARKRLLAVCLDHKILNAKQHTALVKMADRNYLQQADEALTKVLNEKAEEFQNTIAPLQQALQTIQQAEALTNPLNVAPPAGTVNVLPQQDPAVGAQAPQEPASPVVDPAAAALTEQPQQLQARKRRAPAKKVRGATRPQKRALVVADPNQVWSKSPHSVRGEFVNRLGSGVQPDDVFRQMIAEITDHHQQGTINNRDAHRAANEAFGRLLLSRRSQPKQSVRKGAPFAGYEDFESCEQANDDKRSPSAYCGEIKHRTEDKTGQRKEAWSGWGPSRNPKRHAVPGWEWDSYLEAYTASKARKFQCSCGAPVKVPDYHRCKCGKVFNSYVIGTGGDRHEASAEKFLVREIPERDVIVASRKKRKADVEEENPFPSNHHPDHGKKMKSTPKDWYKRDNNQRWVSG